VKLSAVANTAAQYLGVLDSGESLSAQQWTDALGYTNSMLDNWSVDELLLLSVVRYIGTLAGGTQSYPIGTGQTFNTPRPVSIIGGSLILAAGPGNPVKFVNAHEWTALPDRQAQSYAVRFGFYDRQETVGHVYFSPIPLGSATVELLTLPPLPQFVDTNTTDLTFPGPGYQDLYTYGCALRMASQMSVPVPQSVMDGWNQAAQRLRMQNAKLWGELPPEMAAGAK
jgi:hypothetical protein